MSIRSNASTSEAAPYSPRRAIADASSTDAAPDVASGSDGVVLAFPNRPDDNRARDAGDDGLWRYRAGCRGGEMEFSGDVSYVDGAEGDRLRHELAVVTRDLLAWAADRERDADRDASRDDSAVAEHAREQRAA